MDRSGGLGLWPRSKGSKSEAGVLGGSAETSGLEREGRTVSCSTLVSKIWEGGCPNRIPSFRCQRSLGALARSAQPLG